jgi:hypothetical protein
MNSFAYILYLLLTYIITVQVGLIFYRNGRVYILRLLHGDTELTDFINKLLLVGYYLLNLGYAALMIQLWQLVDTWEQVLTSVLTMTGRIMLTLAAIHFINMTVIYLFSIKRNNIQQHKN